MVFSIPLLKKGNEDHGPSQYKDKCHTTENRVTIYTTSQAKKTAFGLEGKASDKQCAMI
jgi:hypothetical protein